MSEAFQVDKYHFNNHLDTTYIGDRFSGFCIEDQSKVLCIKFDEKRLNEEQIGELQRVNLILAQKEHENVLKPLAWGVHGGRHYVVFPDFGRPLNSYENLKPLPPAELLVVLRMLLKALCFADAKDVAAHGSIRSGNIAIDLENRMVKLGFFGYPLTTLAPHIDEYGDPEQLLQYFPPKELVEVGMSQVQLDLYALGLIALELATSQPADELVADGDRLEAETLRAKIAGIRNLPLPVQELLNKLLSPGVADRYKDFQTALEDIVKLTGEEEKGLSFQTFILDTLINGRFKLGEQIARGRVSQIYNAVDLHKDEGTPCVVKLIDLRSHPEMTQLFHTKFKQLIPVRHEHLLDVYDVGVHFENGYIAMEAGMISLEELLIKRGVLPLTDAGRIVFQICKALNGLHFNQINYHGAIKPSNVFLSHDLRAVKLGDTIIADHFLRGGNLNAIGAEYYNPEYIKNAECDVRSDIYSLGTLFFEMLVGHPPFSFKIEQEIIDDHLNMDPMTRIESSLISPEVKEIILQMLEKNPAGRYQKINDLRDELIVLLGYDKKEQVEVPSLYFDYSELNMVGKNAREKTEEVLAVRLPAVNNRARGALALLVGHGREVGDAGKAATSALKSLREMLFNPGSVSPEFTKLQKEEPDQFLNMLMLQLNQRLYREAFGAGKTKSYGLSAVLALVQENTLYINHIGEVEFSLLAAGSIVDKVEDKWTISDEMTLGEAESALSDEVHERLGFGEMIHVTRLKRRLKDGDQLIMLSRALVDALSVSEVKEMITSSSEPVQAIEMVRSDAIRRRLEGTISCVLLNVGNVVSYAEETISHAKKGMLARNFLAQGDTYLNDGRIDEAIEQYNQAIEINPNFAIIHHQLGVAYNRKGLSNYALACFERALQLNSKLASSYIEMAIILQNQRRQREIMPLFREAVANGCKDAELFAMMGRELLRIRNYDEAVLYCTYALQLEPNNTQAFQDRVKAIRRRNALDTKLLRMFASRQRLADDGKTRITEAHQSSAAEEEE